MARGVSKTLTIRPPPQAWLANCLHPGARVVTVSAKEMGAAVEAASKSAGRGGGVKRGRGEGSGAKYTVTEQDGYIWVQCDDCSKWRYAPEDKVDKSRPDAKWKVRARDPRRQSKPKPRRAHPLPAHPTRLLPPSVRDDARRRPPGRQLRHPRGRLSPRHVLRRRGRPPPPGWRREVIPRKTVSGRGRLLLLPLRQAHALQARRPTLPR